MPIRRAAAFLPLLLAVTLLVPPDSEAAASEGRRVDDGRGLTFERGDRRIPAPVRRAVARRRPLLVALSLDPVEVGKLRARGRLVRGITRRLDRIDRVRVVRRYSRLPLVAIRAGSKRALRRVVRTRNVASVSVDSRVRRLDSVATTHIGVPALRAAGAAGTGAEVAVIDDGLRLGDYFGDCPRAGAAGCSVGSITDVAGGGRGARDTHGTGVASIVHSIAPSAKISAYDVFPPDEASLSDVARALDLVVARQRATKGPVIANMSLGVSPAASATLCRDGGPLLSSVRQATAAKVVTVAASGNENTTNQVAYPSCIEGVLSVGATADSAFSQEEDTDGDGDADTRFSYRPDDVINYSNSSPDLDVWGTVNWTLNGFIDFNGTSAASPSVAGVAATLAGARPSLEAGAVNSALTTTGPVVTDPRNGIARHRVAGGPALARIGGRVTPTVLPDDGLKRVVTRYYTGALDRQPDELGLRYWYDRVRNDCANQMRPTFAAFFLLDEYRARNRSVPDTVARMYRAGFGREPDARGAEFWAQRIATRGLPATLNDFSAFAEFTRKSTAPACG